MDSSISLSIEFFLSILLTMKHTIQILFQQFIQLGSSRNYLNEKQKQLLLQYRENNPSICGEDELILEDWLKTKQNLFFIVELILVVKTLQKKLLPPLVFWALDIQDHDFDRRIMEVCVRIFGFKEVDDLLFTVFKEGDDEQKTKVIQLLYHVTDESYIWDEAGGYYDELGICQQCDENQDFL